MKILLSFFVVHLYLHSKWNFLVLLVFLWPLEIFLFFLLKLSRKCRILFMKTYSTRIWLDLQEAIVARRFLILFIMLILMDLLWFFHLFEVRMYELWKPQRIELIRILQILFVNVIMIMLNFPLNLLSNFVLHTMFKKRL